MFTVYSNIGFSGAFTLFMEPLNHRILDIGIRIPNMEPKPFQMQEIHSKTAEILVIEESARK